MHVPMRRRDQNNSLNSAEAKTRRHHLREMHGLKTNLRRDFVQYELREQRRSYIANEATEAVASVKFVASVKILLASRKKVGIFATTNQQSL